MRDVLFTDNDPKVCAWLQALIDAGELHGDVLCQDIRTITPEQVNGRRQVHFFAGIGGWALALRYAGWPDDRPVWTGSCPCQPFSSAGKRRAERDERHVWPEFQRLIAECSPATVFGEQVASRLGRDWLAGVRADLEALGYAVGAADLCAAGVGAPHIRQRLWWVADAGCSGDERELSLAHASGSAGEAESEARQRERRGLDAGGSGAGCGLGDAERQGRARQPHAVLGASGAPDWAKSEWLPCADGKSRRIEPGLAPLAHGIPARVVRLRGYGNAIVPQVAAAFVSAYMEANQTNPATCGKDGQ